MDRTPISEKEEILFELNNTKKEVKSNKRSKTNSPSKRRTKSDASTISQLSKVNHIIGQQNINILKSHTSKEKLLKDLRQDYKYYKSQKEANEQKLTLTIQKRIESEQNKNEIKKYSEIVREKYKDFVVDIDKFEKSLYELKQDKELKLKQNEDLKKNHLKEKANLEKQIEVINEKIKIQMDNLEQLNQKYNYLVKTKEEDKKELMSQETKDIENFNSLFRNYRETLNKYNVFESEENNREVGEIAQKRKEFKNGLVKEQLINQLNDLKMKNEELEKEYRDLNYKENTISCFYNSNKNFFEKTKGSVKFDLDDSL